jgi:hypothetical protein
MHASGFADITMDSPLPPKKSWRESLGLSSKPHSGATAAAKSFETQAHLKQSPSLSSTGKLFARDDGVGAYIPDMFDDVATN